MSLTPRSFVIGVVMVNESETFTHYLDEILTVSVILRILEVVFVILKNKPHPKKMYSNVNSCHEDPTNAYHLFNLKPMQYKLSSVLL